MLRKIINVSVNNLVLIDCNRSVTFSRTPLRILKKSELASSGRPKARADKKSAPRLSASNKTEDVSERIHQRGCETLDGNDYSFLKTMTGLKSKKKHEKNALILLEGRRLIIDAIEARVPVKCIYFTNEDQFEGVPLKKLPEDVNLFKISSQQMQTWSNLTTCPGIMGIFKKPSYDELIDPEKECFPVSVVCDNIREPGNMGSILRCAAAVGCYKVYVTKGCVDVWDTKVLRTGCGAHFRVPIVMMDWDSIGNYLSPDVALYLADNCPVPPSHTRNEERNAKEARVTITSSQCYTNISYGACEALVIVGGETEGLSEEAQELASIHGGVRIVIPMENNVDSLNSAMALSIILFEMKRQYQTFVREK